ncbi:site-specific integrase [Yersinia similis]
MAVRKLTTGKWICECYPNGRRGERLGDPLVTDFDKNAFAVYREQKPFRHYPIFSGGVFASGFLIALLIVAIGK